MIIQDFEKPVVVDQEVSATPPKFRVTFHMGNVDGVAYRTYGYGKSLAVAEKMADQAWEDYKKSHYGPNVHVETVRNATERTKVDKYDQPA